MRCDFCEEAEALYLIGHMKTGEQQACCHACYARLSLQVAKATLPPEEIAAVLGPLFVQGAPAAEPKGTRGRTRADNAVEIPGPEPDAAGDPVVADEEKAQEAG